MSLQLSKGHIVGNLMSRLICICDEGDGLVENEGSQQHEVPSSMNRCGKV